jgi:hypothetical protein
LRKWCPQIAYQALSDETVFLKWLEGGFEKFMKQLAKETGSPQAELDAESIKNACLEGRKQYLAAVGGLSALRKKQYANQLTQKILNSFSEDVEVIDRQLNNFADMTVSSEQNLIVGFFDDLLHLAGEFLQTDVCTYEERGRQVVQGSKEGYHFGVLALKDRDFRNIGFSQVQILTVPIAGVAEKPGKKYQVLALTGINILEGDIPIGKDKAVLAILKAACALAERAGLQGVVIVENPAIHSNQAGVKR